jgi:nucleotide-binding universal stress UspA family protein
LLFVEGGAPRLEAVMTFKKILIAHDFSEPADRAVRFARDLAKQVGATLDAVYVMPDLYGGRADEIAALPPTQPGEAARYLEFLRQELARVVRAALGDDDAHVTTHASRGDPVKRIEELATELKADVLCVGATGKGAVARALMGSTSQALLRGSRIPVLVVP